MVEIIWHQNPLRSEVLLNDNDKQLLWHKVKIEELLNGMCGAHMYIQDALKSRWWVPAGIIKKALKELDYTDAIDAEVDRMTEVCIQDLRGWHMGDCTCFANSCAKCHAEHMLGIDTIKGLGKHAGSYVSSAFDSTVLGAPERTTAEAIDVLINRDDSEKTDTWSNYSDEQWDKLVARWNGERKEAIKWLKVYQANL